MKGLSNPASQVKSKALYFNLKKDLEVGRRRPCAFRDIYLSNIASYEKSYHLVNPFLNADFFPSASARCNVVIVVSSRVF